VGLISGLPQSHVQILSNSDKKFEKIIIRSEALFQLFEQLLTPFITLSNTFLSIFKKGKTFMGGSGCKLNKGNNTPYKLVCVPKSLYLQNYFYFLMVYETFVEIFGEYKI
jgi:hypothetical protein